MKEQWDQIESILKSQGVIPHIEVNDGATSEEIQALEEHVGVSLPQSLKEFLSIHNGQSSGPGLFFGVVFLSTSEIARQWDAWDDLDDMNEDMEDDMSSKPEGVIKPLYVNRKWIPLTHDYSGNHIGIDFDPDTKGTPGQIIAFGRDQDMKILKAKSFDDFIAMYISQLQSLAWGFKPEHWMMYDKNYNFHYNDWSWDALEKVDLYPNGRPQPQEKYISIWVSAKGANNLPTDYYYGEFRKDFKISSDYSISNYAFSGRTKGSIETLLKNDRHYKEYTDQLMEDLSRLGINEVNVVHVAENFNYQGQNTGITKNDKFVFVGSYKVDPY